MGQGEIKRGFHMDADHKQAAVAIGGTAIGHATKHALEAFGQVDWASLASFATFIFVIMQAVLLLPKYAFWLRRAWQQWKAK